MGQSQGTWERLRSGCVRGREGFAGTECPEEQTLLGETVFICKSAAQSPARELLRQGPDQPRQNVGSRRGSKAKQDKCSGHSRHTARCLMLVSRMAAGRDAKCMRGGTERMMRGESCMWKEVYACRRGLGGVLEALGKGCWVGGVLGWMGEALGRGKEGGGAV